MWPFPMRSYNQKSRGRCISCYLHTSNIISVRAFPTADTNSTTWALAYYDRQGNAHLVRLGLTVFLSLNNSLWAWLQLQVATMCLYPRCVSLFAHLSVCLSARNYSEPLNKFSRRLILASFTKICWHIAILVKRQVSNNGIWHEELHASLGWELPVEGSSAIQKCQRSSSGEYAEIVTPSIHFLACFNRTEKCKVEQNLLTWLFMNDGVEYNLNAAWPILRHS